MSRFKAVVVPAFVFVAALSAGLGISLKAHAQIDLPPHNTLCAIQKALCDYKCDQSPNGPLGGVGRAICHVACTIRYQQCLR